MPQPRSHNFKSLMLKSERENFLGLLSLNRIVLAAKTTNSTGSAKGPRESRVTQRIQERRLKILVVDDEKKFRTSLRFNLINQYSALVDEANSGSQGVEMVQANKSYDLIMVDLKMRGKNGIETYKELVGIVHAGCNFALMSAWPDSEEWDEANQLSVVLLQKPIPPEDLRELLDQCVGGGN